MESLAGLPGSTPGGALTGAGGRGGEVLGKLRVYWGCIGVILGVYRGYIGDILGGEWKIKWKLLFRVSSCLTYGFKSSLGVALPPDDDLLRGVV